MTARLRVFEPRDYGQVLDSGTGSQFSFANFIQDSLPRGLALFLGGFTMLNLLAA
jgi:hypothetical protein